KSRTWPDGVPVAALPPLETVLRSCTAIGYSARATEEWAKVGHVAVECVGIAPFPGARLPRVAGLLRGARSEQAPSLTLQYVHGNVLEPRAEGPKIVCQLVNDSAR